MRKAGRQEGRRGGEKGDGERGLGILGVGEVGALRVRGGGFEWGDLTDVREFLPTGYCRAGDFV